MKNKKIPILLSSEKFGELKLQIGKEISKISNWKNIIEIQSFINDFIQYTEYWNQYIYYYKDYSMDKIKKFLDQQDIDRIDEYSIGENFALFTQDKMSNSNNIPDNDAAAKKIKKMYEKKFGKNHELDFEPESSYCYIYTTNRKEAEQFLWWSYTEIIKPILDEIQH